MCRTVAYYRVSTAKQGRSGLGLEAQRNAVREVCTARGWQVTGEFTEVESGKKNDRTQLTAALQVCKLTGAKLVVAKLDRLSRDAAFTLQLRNSGVEFVCADQPDVNSLTIGILAVINQDERERISQRTKDALKAAKARGVKLGNPNGAAALRRENYSPLGVEANKAKADGFAEELRGTVGELKAQGVTSLEKIAKALNERGIMSARGGKWYASSVKNLLARLD